MSRRVHHPVAALILPCLLVAAPGTAAAFQITPAPDGAVAGQTLTVEREVVTLIVVGSEAGWNSGMVWDGDTPASFYCGEVPPGFTTLVGRFHARQELGFTLVTPAGDLWTTGPGERNSDGVGHAKLTATSPESVLVEWEDLSGGGDADYNDCVVHLSITKAR